MSKNIGSVSTAFIAMSEISPIDTTSATTTVGAHGPGPPSRPGADAGLPCTDVMDPAVPPPACGGEAYPNEDKAGAILISMAHGGEAYPNVYKAAAIRPPPFQDQQSPRSLL